MTVTAKEIGHARGRGLHLPTLKTDVPAGWTWHRLDALCAGIFDCPHSTPTLTSSGPYLARSQDIRSGVFRLDDAGHVSESIYRERIARAEPHQGDLFFSREGTYFGIAAEVPGGVRVCLGQRMVLIRPDTSRAVPRWLRYWLNSPLLAKHVWGFRDGTVAERLNLPTIRALPVLVPPVDQQAGISMCLGGLDDKIELNRQMNRTLEAMAEGLFKSWFVEFDPVVAKSAGRPAFKAGADLGTLLPSCFSDSEVGPIPEGWQVLRLGDITELVYGESLTEKQRRPGTVPVFGSGGQVGWHDTPLVAGPGVIVGRKGNAGQISWCETEFFPIDTTFYVRPRRSDIGLRYLYQALRIVDLENLSGDSAVPGLNRELAYSVKLAVPPPDLADKFEAFVASLQRHVLANEEQSRSLSALRDTLVPKLLSGKIRVREAERAVERAGA